MLTGSRRWSSRILETTWANRDHATLYLLPEPSEDDASVSVARQIDFRYPDGPRDAEAVTIDPEANEILLLSKRDVPPRLYALPLDTAAQGVVTAEYRRDLDELPKPTSLDFALAHALKSWHWQPTAMDLGVEGKLAVLTYAGRLPDRVGRWRGTLPQDWRVGHCGSH